MSIDPKTIRVLSPEEMRGPANAPERDLVIAFEGVTKRFGETTAVKDVSFRIFDLPQRGELVVLLGPSG
ncbi:MAG: hypothetical protein ACAI25_02400 [Planctomycetota bacterium]